MTTAFTLHAESAIRQLEDRAFDQCLQEAARTMDAYAQAADDARLPLLSLTRDMGDLPAIRDAAGAIRGHSARVIVFGTGGSSLGGQSLLALTRDAFGRPLDGPDVKFYDNVDPHTLASLEECIVWGETSFVVCSKSGSTMETASQFLMLMGWLRARGAAHALKERVWVVTDRGSNPLRDLAAELGCRILDGMPGVGGRYSVLTVFGLLPAAIGGMDIAALRAGAADAVAAGKDAPPVLGAALNAALLDSAYAGAVMMPYCDRLAAFSAWYKQLIGESLGKSGTGITPHNALGTVDQHSQLQLYLDGPKDKHFTLIQVASKGRGPALAPAGAAHGALGYLEGKTVGDVLDAEFRATAETLMQNGCPVRVVTMAELNAFSYGALLMHYMVETILTGKLMAIDPFDQPAVDAGKRIARDLLSGMAAAA